MNARSYASGLMVAVAVLWQTSSVCADPSIARVGHGGITFLKTNEIRMLEEVLEISKQRVRVRFVFLNESEKDVHTTVAFPLPSFEAGSLGDERAIHQQIEYSFKVWSNGRAVLPATARRAVIGRRDVTRKLRKIGLSEDQIFGPVENAKEFVQGLTEQQESSLEKLSDKEGYLRPWSIAVTLWWKQSFPAKKQVVIEQEYAPISGRVYGGSYQLGGGHETDGSFNLPSDHTERACLDESTSREIEHRIKEWAAEGPKMIYVTTADVEYILSTGRNWKGPIGKFTLKIKKQPPDQFVSLCFPGKPKQVSPTEYEFVQKNYVPQDRLVVYFYDIGPGIK